MLPRDLHIAGLFLGIRSENEGEFYGRLNFCEEQQVQAESKIFYYDLLSTQSVRGEELHFNGPFCYLQKNNDPLPCSTTRWIIKKGVVIESLDIFQRS